MPCGSLKPEGGLKLPNPSLAPHYFLPLAGGRELGEPRKTLMMDAIIAKSREVSISQTIHVATHPIPIFNHTQHLASSKITLQNTLATCDYYHTSVQPATNVYIAKAEYISTSRSLALPG